MLVPLSRLWTVCSNGIVEFLVLSRKRLVLTIYGKVS